MRTFKSEMAPDMDPKTLQGSPMRNKDPRSKVSMYSCGSLSMLVPKKGCYVTSLRCCTRTGTVLEHLILGRPHFSPVPAHYVLLAHAPGRGAGDVAAGARHAHDVATVASVLS